MADFKPKARDKNVLDSKRMTLSMPCPVKGVKGFSNLYFYANNDNPGITVYTGDPNDKENNFGRIQAKFGLMDMMILLEALDAVARSKEPTEMNCVCKSVRNDRQVDVADVVIAKRADGVVTIKVIDLERRGRPEIEFPFAPTRFHIFGINGQPATEAAISVLVARAWHRVIGDMVTEISKDTYKHPEPKNGPGGNGGGNRGGGGGNYNNNNRGGGGGGSSNYGGRSGGGNQSSGSDFSDMDDDIAF